VIVLVAYVFLDNCSVVPPSCQAGHINCLKSRVLRIPPNNAEIGSIMSARNFSQASSTALPTNLVRVIHDLLDGKPGVSRREKSEQHMMELVRLFECDTSLTRFSRCLKKLFALSLMFSSDPFTHSSTRHSVPFRTHLPSHIFSPSSSIWPRRS